MKKDSKIVISIIVGGLIIISLLLLTLFTVIGGISTLNSAPNGDTVAVIPLQGEIGYGSTNSSDSVVTPDMIQNSISQAESDSSVSSIVIDVNSPGGSPVASEEIMNTIKSSKKPVVVWISDVGASGAYLASSSADKIIASPSSMVGSIGVIMQITDLSKYYQENGINISSIKAGQYKDMGADYQPLTTTERNMLQGMVNQDYDHFIDIVSTNRNLSKNYTESIAQGKIYTGTQAKKLKLVDETGGKTVALDEAAKLGGIKGSYNVITISPTSNILNVLNNFSSMIAYSIGMGIGKDLQNNTNNNLKVPITTNNFKLPSIY
ncbi:MAG: signal peptide peptidase SppA [Methanobacterium sp.]|uniref:signal peptide peptidase SppA n=1 Tax=Methanobacterium sp. TaxID=2164 RepID=UPI003C77E641